MAGFDATVWRAESQPTGATVAVRMLRPGRPAAREVGTCDCAAELDQPAPAVIATGRCAGARRASR